MSGPRPRMGGERLIDLKVNNPHLLCQHCGPSAGWGWELPESEMRWRGGGHLLPSPGNGYSVIGVCPYCKGSGIDPFLWYELGLEE